MNHINEIEKLRVSIHALKAERDALADSGLTREELRARIREQVETWHVEGQRHAEVDLQRVAAGDMVNFFDIERPRGLGPLLVRLFGAAEVEAGLLKGIDAVPEGIRREDRLARVAVIETELDELETREEALIDCAEAEGLDVRRRADARPEIVLAGPVGYSSSSQR